MLPENKRHDPRIRKPLIIRFRDPAFPDAGWEVVSSLNISRSGMCFLTMKKYAPGTELGLQLKSAELGKEIELIGRVVRSDSSKKVKIFFETAVNFSDIAPEARELFEKLIVIGLERERSSS
jgi:hypothetical protein